MLSLVASMARAGKPSFWRSRARQISGGKLHTQFADFFRRGYEISNDDPVLVTLRARTTPQGEIRVVS